MTAIAVNATKDANAGHGPAAQRARRLAGVVLRRVGRLVLLLFGATSFVFIALHLSGDPASVMSGPNATEAQVVQTRARLGLDESLPVQYLEFISNTARLDFGTSFSSGLDALEVATAGLPKSLALAIPATLGIALVGTSIGLLGATTKRSWLRRSTELFAFGVQGVPFFWLGLVLVLVFAINLQWLPATGSGSLKSAILPIICLMVGQIAAVARLTRGELVDALAQPYVVTARSKGITRRQVLARHVAPNVAPTLVSFCAVIFTFTVGALIIVEPMFTYGGLGSTLVNSVRSQDFPVVSAGILLIALLVGVASIIADFIASLCSPALAAQQRGGSPS